MKSKVKSGRVSTVNRKASIDQKAWSKGPKCLIQKVWAKGSLQKFDQKVWSSVKSNEFEGGDNRDIRTIRQAIRRLVKCSNDSLQPPEIHMELYKISSQQRDSPSEDRWPVADRPVMSTRSGNRGPIIRTNLITEWPGCYIPVKPFLWTLQSSKAVPGSRRVWLCQKSMLSIKREC